MNSFKIICSHFHRKCNFLVRRTFSSTNSNMNLILGLAPVIPSVSAQNELKNVSVKNDTEKYNETKIESVTPEDISMPKPSEITEVPKDDGNGWDRLRAVFQKDEFGNYSKEMTATIQSTCIACFLGLIYGGINSSRAAFLDFMERNQATIFENHIDAKRRLQNHVTVHFAKGGFSWACKLSLFTGGFMLFLTSVQAYRGRRSVIDYAMSGTVVGALVRVKLGVPGLVIGGCLGCLLGLTCGLMTSTLLMLTGTSFDDVLSFQYELDQSRRNALRLAQAQAFEQDFISKEGIDLIKNRPYDKEETEA
uniref:Complex I assembly factor TIMMDC1, mitochondrial n=1 Tax=Cuerna arida TaxID=1464854 RepID=A0A1B6G9V1_9HEMI